MGLFGRKKAQKTSQTQAPKTHRLLRLAKMPAAIYAVGDIHGCADLYDALEKKIVADGEKLDGTKLIVSLGDVVDRGGASAAVIDRLMSPAPKGFKRLVLRGNHEDMMIKFMSDPDANRKWLDFGGTETLASYGLSPDPEVRFDLPASRLRHMMDAAIPESHRKFLKELPLALSVGPYRFAHASYDRDTPLEDQLPETLMWGAPQNADAGSADHVFVHGHVVVDKPFVSKKRINVDTGAYSSGVLSAVRLTAEKEDKQLLTVTLAN